MTEIDEFTPPEGAIHLGGEHWYVKVVDKNDAWIGINEWHRHGKTGKICGGWVPFRTPATDGYSTKRDRWDVSSYEPLTMSPSLACAMPDCGSHGFIENGAWRDA